MFHVESVAEPWLWTSFIGGVLFLVLADLYLLYRNPHPMTVKEAVRASIFWVALALGFNAFFAWRFGTTPGVEFLTGYVVELSLSIDNLFVILLIFRSFRIPSMNQHRVLFWGIFGAITLRGLLIVAGVGLINRFHWIIYIFGVILIMSAVKFLTESDESGDVTETRFVKAMRKMLPLSPKLHGNHFMIVEEGKRKFTLLFLALLVVEFSDLIFAVDSIPAVFGVTKDPFVAFSSNILAVLGLRALYFVVAEWVGKLRYLKPGLAVVLAFVGTKMLISGWFHIPGPYSLAVIVGVLLTAGLSSWYVDKRKKG